MRRIVGYFIVGIVAGIVSIFLYRFVQVSNSGISFNGQPQGYDSYSGRNVNFSSELSDSINNVFNVGFGEAAESSLQNVVHIRSRMYTQGQSNPFSDGFWEQQYRENNMIPRRMQESSGSGVIISNDGFIVTNNHVIDNASEIIVSLYNRRIYKAEIVGTDPSTDIAVIKIEGKDFPKASLANSDQVRVGDWVLAVGNPFNLASTVTAGIVSAKARNIHILNDNSAVESFIQTDAAVNPGNSGGALVNLKGELIGINTAIATPTGTYAGYAFAVPSNIVGKVVDDLIKYKEVRRGYLGVMVSELDWELAQSLDLKVSEGVVIANVVQGGAADRAGLKVKDVVVEINGKPIRTTAEFLGIVASFRPKDVIDLTIQRGEKQKAVKVKLQKASEEIAARDVPIDLTR